MKKTLERFLEAVSKSRGFQVGLPNGSFYYEIPKEFNIDFENLNKKLKSTRIMLQDKEIDNDSISVFAKGEPMTVDNGPQLLLSDINSKIYYCYSLDYPISHVKLLYNSIEEMLPSLEYLIDRLSNQYVTVDLTAKKLKDIVNVKMLVPFDAVEVNKDNGNLLTNITLNIFNKHKIDINDFHVATNSAGLLQMSVDSLNEKMTCARNGDHSNYLKFLDRILKLKQKRLKSAIIETPTWDKTIGIGEEILGLGLFTDSEYNNLKINRFVIY